MELHLRLARWYTVVICKEGRHKITRPVIGQEKNRREQSFGKGEEPEEEERERQDRGR